MSGFNISVGIRLMDVRGSTQEQSGPGAQPYPTVLPIGQSSHVNVEFNS